MEKEPCSDPNSGMVNLVELALWAIRFASELEYPRRGLLPRKGNYHCFYILQTIPPASVEPIHATWNVSSPVGGTDNNANEEAPLNVFSSKLF